MVRIQRVGTLDDHTIDIQFTNSHVLLLDMDQLNDPRCRSIVANGEWCRPHTDGQRIWWNGGPNFSISDLMHILADEKGE